MDITSPASKKNKISLEYSSLFHVTVLSCQAIVVHQLVHSWLVRFVVYNLASYGPELYAGIATPDASVNSYIETEKSQRRVNLV